MPALDGVRVADLSQVIAAPYCTQLLADLGAEVIKVEEPGFAAFTRVALSPPSSPMFSPFWIACNRNKKSITLDLKQDGAKRVLADLVKRSDVVVENFSESARESLGISEEWGSSVNEKIIWASLTSAGRTGPDRYRQGYDFLAQARSGYLSTAGDADGPPMKAGVSISDYLAGTHLAVAILGALVHRERTGEGQLVEVSLLEAMTACLDGLPLWSSIAEQIPQRAGNFHQLKLPGYSIFRCTDGYIALAALGEAFVQLLEVVGAARLGLMSPLSVGPEEYQEYFSATVEAIEAWSSQRTRSEARELLDAAGVPNEPVQDLNDIWSDRQLIDRGMIIDAYYEGVGTFKSIGSPMHLTKTPPIPESHLPQPGEHTAEVLRRVLEYTDQEIEELERKGVTKAMTLQEALAVRGIGL